MRRKKIVTIASAGLASSMPYVDFKFDQGSMASYTIVSASTPAIRITPIKHWSNQWAWWGIRSKSWRGKTPHFLIAKASHYSFSITEKLCQWSTSADTDNWYLFDNQNDTGTDLEFYNNSPFPGGTIYIAALPMYPLSRIQRKTAEWLGNPLVSLTTSGSPGGIVGYSISRALPDSSGRTVPALPYYGFKVSTGSTIKNKGVITAYNHPSETPGPYQLEGAINWLLGGTPEATGLLNYFDFYVYPCINPQGVWGGWFRSFPEAPTEDHNRIWGTSGTYDEVDKLKNIWLTDAGSSIEVGLDFHSWMSSGATPFLAATASSSPEIVKLLEKIKIVRPTYSSQDSDISTSLKTWQTNYQNAFLTSAAEIPGALSITTNNYKEIGRDVFRGLELMNREGWFTYSPTVGSRDFNGSIDRIDWTSVANLTGLPITISAWVYMDDNNTTDYVFHIADASDNIGIQFAIIGATSAGAFNFARKGSTTLSRYSIGAVVTTGQWINLLATHDGTTFGNFTSIHLYKNGAEPTYGGGANGVTETTVTGKWSAGGRYLDDLRNVNGKIAQIGVWNRVLTSSEITQLGSGYAPSFFEEGLIFYFRGDTASLANEMSGLNGTADGTTYVSGSPNGPAILYPPTSPPLHFMLGVHNAGQGAG